MGMFGGDVILHLLIMDSSDDLADLLVLRYVLHIEVAITVVIILTCIFGIEITFTQDGAFTRVFLFDSSVAEAF